MDHASPSNGRFSFAESWASVSARLERSVSFMSSFRKSSCARSISALRMRSSSAWALWPDSIKSPPRALERPRVGRVGVDKFLEHGPFGFGFSTQAREPHAKLQKGHWIKVVSREGSGRFEEAVHVICCHGEIEACSPYRHVVRPSLCALVEPAGRFRKAAGDDRMVCSAQPDAVIVVVGLVERSRQDSTGIGECSRSHSSLRSAALVGEWLQKPRMTLRTSSSRPSKR